MVPSIYVSLTLMEAGKSKVSVLIVKPLRHCAKRLVCKKKNKSYNFLLLMEVLAHNFAISEHPVSKTYM